MRPEADLPIEHGFLVARLVAAWPDLAGLPVREVGQGWDNVALRVGARWVVRFPRRARAVAWLRDELRWVGVVAPHLPVVTSAPARIAEDAHGVFGLAPWIAGRSGEHAPFSVVQARELGHALAVLHGLDCPTGPPEDPLRKGDVPHRVQELHRLIDEAGAGRSWHALVDRLASDAGEPGRGWVHGDLHPRHVRIGFGGRIAGVIDWGDLHAGDRAIDLSIGWMNAEGAAREALWEAAGAREAEVRRARLRALFYGFVLRAHGEREGDRLFARQGVRALGLAGPSSGVAEA